MKTVSTACTRPRPRLRASAGCAALAILFALSGCKVGLYSGLNEQEANEMVSALLDDGIDAQKERLESTQWQVLVEKADLPGSLDLLRSQGLPNDRFVSMGDVFQKQGLVSTPAEERMRYIYATSQELSQTLRKVDGVVAARVHVVIPANDPLSDKIRPSSAAVFIKHRPDVDLRILVPAVKGLVSHSIEGLTHEQVSLSLFEAQRTPPRPAARAVTGNETSPFGPLTAPTAVVLSLLALAALTCLAALPWLLRRNGLDWRTWVRRQLQRR